MREALKVRVIFADTDAMGIAYHGNYLKWFEMGRTELIRASGLAYRELVESDIHLPVIEAFCRYLKPAAYDEVLSIFSKIEEIKGVQMRIGYEIKIRRQLIATGYTRHVFTNSEGKVIRPPKNIIDHMTRMK